MLLTELSRVRCLLELLRKRNLFFFLLFFSSSLVSDQPNGLSVYWESEIPFFWLPFLPRVPEHPYGPLVFSLFRVVSVFWLDQFSGTDWIEFWVCCVLGLLRWGQTGEMATGSVPTSFSGLRRMDCNLGSSKSVDFVRVSDMQRITYGRRKVSVIRNSNPSSDIAELQASSEGSPLLGIISVIYYLLFSLCLVY